MKTEIAKPQNKEEVKQIINDTMAEFDSIAGGINSFESSDDLENYRLAANDLLSTLLQMKLVNEDADALKMSKDSKNNKKFGKAKELVDEELDKVDVQEIIESIYSRIGG